MGIKDLENHSPDAVAESMVSESQSCLNSGMQNYYLGKHRIEKKDALAIRKLEAECERLRGIIASCAKTANEYQEIHTKGELHAEQRRQAR